VDFDAATRDPTTGNMKAEYLPNSQFTQLPWGYLHPNHAPRRALLYPAKAGTPRKRGVGKGACLI